jgi:predicted acylesterase/phospholipase RssA
VESLGHRPAQHAVVLTGTLVNAVFEVGVLQGLLGGPWGDRRNAPIQPFCYSGTSFGAFNAAAMVSMAHLPASEALKRIEETWLDRIAPTSGGATGLFRIRGDLTQYLHTKYLTDPATPFIDLARDTFHLAKEFTRRAAIAAATSHTLPDAAVQLGEWSDLMDLTPLRRLIADVIDTEQIVNNQGLCQLRVTAVDWQRGTPRTFDNGDFNSKWADSILVAAQAAPGVTPPELIDGLAYVDSTILFDKPLQPAISAAAQTGSSAPLVLHVIHVDASRRDVPPAISNTIASMFRLFLLSGSRAVLSDIAKADTVNKRLWTRGLLETVLAVSGGRDGETAAEGDPVFLHRWADRDLSGKRPVTIHRYAPKRIYGMELYWLDRQRLAELIQHGLETARSHNCDEAGCILEEPGDEGREAQRNL